MFRDRDRDRDWGRDRERGQRYDDRYESDQRGYRDDRQRERIWTHEKEERLMKFVQDQKQLNPDAEPNWKILAAEFGIRPSAVQNKYVSKTEPNWTMEQDKKLIDLYLEDVIKVDFEKIRDKINEQFSCKHTSRGCMLQLERISKELQRPYKKPRENEPDRSLKDELDPILRRFQDQLDDCMQNYNYRDVSQKCKDVAQRIDDIMKRYLE